MARILVQNDRGEPTLSEELTTPNLAEGDDAARLIERLGWALVDAEQSDTPALAAVRALPER
jgi:hypothetical protein